MKISMHYNIIKIDKNACIWGGRFGANSFSTTLETRCRLPLPASEHEYLTYSMY